MSHDSLRYLEQQKERFEGGTSLIERLIKSPSFPRTMRKKVHYVGKELHGYGRILEVGTGRGLLLDELLKDLGANSSYVGVDLAAGPLRQAHQAVAESRRASAAFLSAAMERLPFRNGSFDAVFCIDVLHHAESQVAMLTELGRVLRPGGRVLCVEPNWLFPTNVLFLRNRIENGLFKFTRRSAAEWTREAGLCDLEIENLPVFFPSFPTRAARPYEWLESIMSSIPLVRGGSTTRALSARRPANHEHGGQE
jgi:ubiquinone/menaquinone biosynthesis C-methylase UbiE